MNLGNFTERKFRISTSLGSGCVDAVTGRKSAHVLADSFDDSTCVQARCKWQRASAISAAANVGIDRIDTDSHDAQQNFTIPDPGISYFCQPHNARLSELLDDDRFHFVYLSVKVRPDSGVLFPESRLNMNVSIVTTETPHNERKMAKR